MRFFVYFVTFLCVLLSFASGVCGCLFMATGYVWFGMLVACLAVAGFTAILGSAVYWRMRK